MFKKILMLACTLVTTLAFTACGAENAEENPSTQSSQPSQAVQSVSTTYNAPEQFAGKKILVAFYSRPGDNYQVGVIQTGNTKIVADMLTSKIGADEFEIKTVKEYPADYKECTDVAKQEQIENARPELANGIPNFADYDLIFLGYPIWWSDLPMLMYTFLESYDWSGKTVIPFCTSAGNNLTGKEADIPNFAKGATVLANSGLGIQGARCQTDQPSVEKDIDNWLLQLGFTAKQ